jgi:hypothetical protein
MFQYFIFLRFLSHHSICFFNVSSPLQQPQHQQARNTPKTPRELENHYQQQQWQQQHWQEANKKLSNRMAFSEDSSASQDETRQETGTHFTLITHTGTRKEGGGGGAVPN